MAQVARHPWQLWVVVVLALAGLAVSAWGWTMAGSFSVSNPTPHSHWQRLAIAYIALGVVSTAALFAAGLALARRARGRAGSGPPTA